MPIHIIQPVINSDSLQCQILSTLQTGEAPQVLRVRAGI